MKFQSYNGKIDAWVKGEFIKNGKVKWLDVKQKKPTVPFKGVPIKGGKKR